jgi:hypothetical protein
MINANITQDTATLGIDTIDQYKKYLISGYHFMTHLRNISNHPIFIEVRTVCARRDRIYGGVYGSVADFVVSDVVNGWKEKMGAGAVGPPVTGEVGLSYVAGGSALATQYHHLALGHSDEFKRNWKTVSYKKFKLNPGDDVYWKMRFRNRVYNRDQEVGAADALQRDIIKGFTKATIVSFVGVLGESTATAGNVATMQSDLAVECWSRATVTLLNQKGIKSSHVEAHHDTLLTDYTGPSRFEHKSDEP